MSDILEGIERREALAPPLRFLPLISLFHLSRGDLVSVPAEEASNYWDWLRPREAFPYDFVSWSRTRIELRLKGRPFRGGLLSWTGIALLLEGVAIAVLVWAFPLAPLWSYPILVLIPLALWANNALEPLRRWLTFGRMRRILLEGSEQFVALGAVRYPMTSIRRLGVRTLDLGGGKARTEIWLERAPLPGLGDEDEDETVAPAPPKGGKRAKDETTPLPLLSTESYHNDEEMRAALERIVRGMASVLRVPLHRT